MKITEIVNSVRCFVATVRIKRGKATVTANTHKLAQNALVNQLKRNALQVKPTFDDLRAAQDKFEGEQKRIDRTYGEALRDREKWAEIRRGRLTT